MKWWVCLIVPLFPVCCLAGATEAGSADALSTRYAPYVDWASFFNPAEVGPEKPPAWWQSPESVREAGSNAERPLAGLHLALDPGHIGGRWAAWEGRQFRMAEGHYWVREGELVLEVALRVADALERMGARVSLLRSGPEPRNPLTFQDYWVAASRGGAPADVSLEIQLAHALAIRDRAMRMAVVVDELAERARLVNQSIRPDALLSLHINAAPWPPGSERRLVESDHAHVLIFGCLLPGELALPEQQARLQVKLANGSGPIELRLGHALGDALAEATGLPASNYSGENAVRLPGQSRYLWARNLMLLRLVDCPAVMLEPYIANSRTSYPRIQKALHARAHHQPLAENDILIEYADAVVAGILQCYGKRPLDGPNEF